MCLSEEVEPYLSAERLHLEPYLDESFATFHILLCINNTDIEYWYKKPSRASQYCPSGILPSFVKER